MTREEWANASRGTVVSGGEGTIGKIVSWFTLQEEHEYVYFVILDFLGYTWMYRRKFLSKYKNMSVEKFLSEEVQSTELNWDDGEEIRTRVQKQIQENMIK